MRRRKIRHRARPSDPDLIDRHATAAMLGIEERTLHRWHKRGYGPLRRLFATYPRDVYYSLAEVQEWMAEHPTPVPRSNPAEEASRRDAIG
jgi:hypothetical protein